ncbi:retron St85 family effector protein [Sulfitobacter pseudonitzschiae]|uniref:Retron St85 family effector protein n=1 Tax=Pseudosulfitobacter pseudonitzschiae TaxID=1402135 RepID=A0A9Q2NKU9_9RHOB|nr:retron St85 family effector protein [Pseudosulfitobacter pseudonitzschiae]MBM2291436.1 retron St85 family effector protein [Pseudosulfitobacter pseudonitzschiae]MBM2296354.1 retron St85 family effector protein [Pseudosulfitobacter pseudonitzschiae]MBM2301267.1 retron St85 family effector protein [Pseudosulfitobacter pseudonitzschiae]MBM2311051.1 retron St85 family effector protein [Pseudosulfitobacter pseudonitzschiae]MBM2315964.1 retron St85 family effector protein [Pseudosulfitobacter pse
MDHPIREDTSKVLRGRVVQLLKEGYYILNQSNIVFVCGGNKSSDMRSQFETVFPKLLPHYEFFKPEFAMENYFSFGDTEPFDIADFETMVAELSIAIVLFPEAPGSFAELGYFSGQRLLSQKTVLALDLNHQHSGSFISLGPATKIAKTSIFGYPIQIDYNNPDFTMVSTRITDHAKLSKRKRKFAPKEFNALSTFELFAFIHRLVNLLVIATGDDVESILRSAFKSHVSPSRIKKVISILVGSGRLREIGDFGHLTASNERTFALTLVDGAKTDLTEISLDISALLYSSENGFGPVLESLT